MQSYKLLVHGLQPDQAIKGTRLLQKTKHVKQGRQFHDLRAAAVFSIIE